MGSILHSNTTTLHNTSSTASLQIVGISPAAVATFCAVPVRVRATSGVELRKERCHLITARSGILRSTFCVALFAFDSVKNKKSNLKKNKGSIHRVFDYMRSQFLYIFTPFFWIVSVWGVVLCVHERRHLSFQNFVFFLFISFFLSSFFFCFLLPSPPLPLGFSQKLSPLKVNAGIVLPPDTRQLPQANFISF